LNPFNRLYLPSVPLPPTSLKKFTSVIKNHLQIKATKLIKIHQQTMEKFNTFIKRLNSLEAFLFAEHEENAFLLLRYLNDNILSRSIVYGSITHTVSYYIMFTFSANAIHIMYFFRLKIADFYAVLLDNGWISELIKWGIEEKLFAGWFSTIRLN